MKKTVILLTSILLFSIITCGCDDSDDITKFLGSWVESGSGDVSLLKDSMSFSYPRYRIPVTVSETGEDKVLVKRNNIDIEATVHEGGLSFVATTIPFFLPHMELDSALLSGTAIAEDGVIHVSYEITGIGMKKNNAMVDFAIRMNAVWRRN